jgi:hypothetical protein
VNCVLVSFVGSGVFVYIDDILIATKMHVENVVLTPKVIQVLKGGNLGAKLLK